MIKAFSDNSITHQSTLISGLSKAVQLKADIVNMSLKSSDFIDKTTGYSKTLETLIDLIPYTVAAAGNDGNPFKAKKIEPSMQKEAYPARLEGITFDIGAFSYNHETKSFPIPLFSQYQIDSSQSQNSNNGLSIGPKFVAPGCNIVSYGLNLEQKNDSIAIMMDGTSAAAPQISGFLALMLSEFKEEFNRDQLLKVCYLSGIYLMDTIEWKQKSIFGSLDMRTALFTLHILRAFKNHCQEGKDLVLKEFDKIALMVNVLLFGMVNEYSDQHLKKVSFKNNFSQFYQQLQEYTQYHSSPDLSNVIFKDFNQAINYCLQVLLFISNLETKKPELLTEKLIVQIKEIYNLPTVILFNDLTQPAQNRINGVFTKSNYTKKEVETKKSVNYYQNYCKINDTLQEHKYV